MSAVHKLITDHLDIWTAADTEKKSGRGRASGNPNSVYGIKKLRELILELAVRGKLVPQDPNDEPASKFLSGIKERKKILLANKQIKKNKNTANFDSSESHFQIPESWCWEKLGTLSTKLTDGSHNPPKDAGAGVPMLSSQNVNFGRIDFSTPSRFVTHEDFELEDARTQIEPDDVLLTIVASLGRPAVVPKGAPKFALQRSVAVIRTELFPHYLCLHLASPYCLAYYDEHGKGTAQKGIYLGQLSELPIAVPPIAEQHRIVAKVDELMALCDQLEAQHNNAADAHEQLVSHLLSTLTQSQDAADFNANWQRIATHFDTLFTTESSIDALKQTLLQLAVMGKLVPQDPNDEPASELLKRIQAEKAKLVAEGKIKKHRLQPKLTQDEEPFALPVQWAWVKLEELMPQFQNGASSRGDVEGVPVIVLRLADIRDRRISIEDPRELSISKSAIHKYSLTKGDLLIVRVNGSADLVGGFIVCEEDFNGIYCDHFIRMRISSQFIDPQFLGLVGATGLVRDRIKDLFITTAGQKTVNQGHIGSLTLPLLSISEQRRIVSRVDELMRLCDQLKDCIADVSKVQKTVANALVDEAVM